jgi:hypothetical protein
MPAAAAEIVCQAALRRARVLFALELPAFEEQALQAFVAGDLDGAAMLQHSQFWLRNRDGRSSVAMFAMLERIRALRQAGLDIDLIAVAPARRLSEADKTQLAERFGLAAGIDRDGSLYDLGMAAAIIDDAQRLGAERVIFLVGNAHAVTAPSESASLNVETGQVRQFIRMHAASALPRGRTLSLVFTHAGGETFAQTREGAGVHPDEASEQELAAPSVVIAPYPANRPRYDGRIFIGPISASPPMPTQ